MSQRIFRAVLLSFLTLGSVSLLSHGGPYAEMLNNATAALLLLGAAGLAYSTCSATKTDYQRVD